MDDTTVKPSDRVMKILNGGKEEIIAALLQSDRGRGILTQAESPEILSEVVLPQVIKQRYPDSTEAELEQVHSGMLQALAVNTLGGVVNGADLPPDAVIDGVAEPAAEYIANNQFVKMGERFINVDNLNIDLIATINPFQQAYEILSKSVTPEMLKTIQTVVNSSKITMTEEEALMLWERIKIFIQQHQRQPSPTANDPLERRMAEAIQFLRYEKIKRMRGE